MSTTTPAQYALILIDLALEEGVERADLFEGTTIAESGTASIGARIPDTDFQRLVLNTLKHSPNPSLGLRLGERLNLSAHAVLGQTFMTCATLSEVIQLFERYYHLLAPDLELTFKREGSRVVIESKNVQAELPQTFGLECIAAAICNTLNGLLGGAGFGIRYEFPYPAPSYQQRYFDVLGDDVHFDQTAARWSFDSSLLSTPLSSSNSALRRLYEAECARLLADLEDEVELQIQTRRLLQKFEGQYPKMPQVAAMLNLSSRTYRRRLAGEGTSFQSVLDDVRSEHATRHLKENRLPIASIAYHLGFTDPSNFRRAYQRWTGLTPGQVRSAEKQS